MTTTTTRRDDRVRIRPDKLAAAEPRDLWIRFAFGFTVSTVAAILGKVFGLRFGGMFLAFPAILPATLTFIRAKESEHEAERDNTGAALAVPGLAPFALVVRAWHDRPALALGLGFVAWAGTALALYAGAWWVRQHAGHIPAPGSGSRTG